MKITHMMTGLALGLALSGSGTASADGKMAHTTEDHVSMAKQYQGRADTGRKEAADHRRMAAGYKDSAANAHAKGQGQPDPWVVKMEKHCILIAEAAERLAGENQKAADFHTFRAKETKGK